MTDVLAAPLADQSASSARHQVDGSNGRVKRGRPRDAGADERILAAAGKLLLERGFDNMTVDDVAALARAGKATVYRRWPTKEDLAVAALAHMYRNELPVPDTGSIVEDLRQFFSMILTFTTDDSGSSYFRTALIDVLSGSPIARIHSEMNIAREAHTAKMFQRAVARGELRPDFPIDWAVRWLPGVLAASMVMGHPGPAVDDVDDLVDFLLRGIEA